MAAYQRSDGESKLPFSNINKFSKNKTLQVPDVLTHIPKISIKNDKASPIFEHPVTINSFNNNEINKSHIEAKATDNTFYFLRQNMDERIDWTDFNQ